MKLKLLPFLLISHLFLFTTKAQTLQRVKYTPSGNISDIEYNDKYGLAVAGDFDVWGINTGNMAKLNITNDSPDYNFPRFYNPINEVISDGNGGWYVSGNSSRAYFDVRWSINEADSIDYNLFGIIHILPNKTIDRNFRLQSSPKYPIEWYWSSIKKMILKNGIIYAMGDFVSRGFGPIPISNVIAINSNNGALLNFPKILGSFDMVNIGNKLYFSASNAGSIKDSLGNVMTGLGVIDINSKRYSQFNIDQNVPGYFSNGRIAEINGKMIATFQGPTNQNTQTKFALFDTLSTTPIWQTVPLPNNSYAGFFTLNSSTFFRTIVDYSQGTRDVIIEAFDLQTGQPKIGWDSQNFRFRRAESYTTVTNITSFEVNEQVLLVGGEFTTINNQSRSNCAMIDLNSKTVNIWNPMAYSSISKIKVEGSNIFLMSSGQLFLKSQQRKRIAFLNPVTQELTSKQLNIPNLLNGQPDNIGSIAFDGDTLWVATSGNGSPKFYGFNLVANEQINFPQISFSSGSIQRVFVKDTLIYIQGSFSGFVDNTGHWVDRKAILVISKSGKVQPFSINIESSSITDMKLIEDLIYLKGRFNSINGVVRNWFASLNRFTGELTNWNPDVVFPWQKDLEKPFEISGNNVVFMGFVNRIGSWNNTNGNTLFFVDRKTGKVTKSSRQGVGNNSGYSYEITQFKRKEKFLFFSFNVGNSPYCDISGTSYLNTENLKYSNKCLSGGNENLTIASNFEFAGERLFAEWSCYRDFFSGSSSARPRLLMQTTFPQGFFNDKLDYFPKRGHNGGSLTVHFYNYGLGYGSKVRFLKSGQSPITVNDSLLSYPEQFTLKTILNLKGKATGDWDVELTLPTGEKIIVPNGFKINPPTPANIQVRLIAPSATRPGAPTKMTLIVSNLGEVDAYDVPIYLAYSKNVRLSAKISFWSIGKFNDVDTLSKFKLDTLIAQPFDGWGSMLSLSELSGGETFEIPLKAISDNTSPLNSLNVRVFTQNPTISSNTSNFRFQVANNGTICNSPPNPCLASLMGALADAATTLLPPGASNIVSCSLGTLGYIKDAICKTQTLSDHLGSISSVLWDCSGLTGITAKLGIFGIFGDALNDAYSYRKTLEDIDDNCFPKPDPKKENGAEIPIVTSRDPNDKLGPVGVHSQRYIKGNDPMSYLIRFENYASATAAAQYIKVIDTLDINKFDFSTFQFGYFNVADTNFYATPGRKNYMRDWDLRPAKNLILRMEAAFNDTTGILKATYTALDPATMEWTEDPFLGFLPPNVNAPEGEGSLFFTISPKPTLVHNEQISNKAYIYFDYNPVIPTPVWTNTLDKIIPSSQVQALPSVSRDTTFALSWAGNDVGAGTRLYDVYVSVNSNPYKLLVTNSTLTNINFKGKPDSTYKFYSIAVDSVGNEESVPVTFDTQTTIRLSTLIQSVKTGNWNDPTTWDCNCIPAILDNVTIKAGHKITVSPVMGIVKCRNLTVESGAIFDGRGVFEADSKH